LVDLLVARRRDLRAHGDRGAGLIELEVIGFGAVLDNANLVLGVAGVGHSLQAHALIGVVASSGDGERLVHVAAVGILLVVLGNRRIVTTVVVVVMVVVVVVMVVVVVVRRKDWKAATTIIVNNAASSITFLIFPTSLLGGEEQ
jgi:Mn2+/Fe2+ NRAMP family transporter